MCLCVGLFCDWPVWSTVSLFLSVSICWGYVLVCASVGVFVSVWLSGCLIVLASVCWFIGAAVYLLVCLFVGFCVDLVMC